mgnify:CR=1 FL=1
MTGVQTCALPISVSGSTLKQHLISSARLVTNLFLVWVLVGAAWAFWQPSAFTWFKPYVGPGLGVIMFGMGMTLTPADFQRVARQPVAVLIGVGAQYLVMPLVAVAVARALQLPADLAAGLILVGCCPGGTASNVMTYLARGDVALSVSLTTVSTLAAVLATPWLMQVLGGQYVPVDAAALMRSILLVVILPVLAGLLVHRYGGAAVETAIGIGEADPKQAQFNPGVIDLVRVARLVVDFAQIGGGRQVSHESMQAVEHHALVIAQGH